MKGVFALLETADFIISMKNIHLLLIAYATLFTAYSLSAHCQIPCGIFSDELKFNELEEHVVTIEKSAGHIRDLTAKKDLTENDHQQLIRWTINKETHAQKIIDETANYFLAQRIKTDAKYYTEKIKLLHHIIVYAMKTKQSIEKEATYKLSKEISVFKKLYYGHTQAQ